MTTSTRPAQTVAATRSRPGPTVFVIGDERFARRLGEHFPDSRVRNIQAPDETDGFGVDLILIADAYPLSTLADVLVHPSLSRLPVVLVAPGRDIDRRGWGDGLVHVVVDGEDPLASQRSTSGNGSGRNRSPFSRRQRPAEADRPSGSYRSQRSMPGSPPSAAPFRMALAKA